MKYQQEWRNFFSGLQIVLVCVLLLSMGSCLQNCNQNLKLNEIKEDVDSLRYNIQNIEEALKEPKP